MINQIVQLTRKEFATVNDFFHVNFDPEYKQEWPTWLVSWEAVNDYNDKLGQLNVETCAGGVAYVCFY